MRFRILFLFLILNFGALALGSLFTNSGVTGDWYLNLHKAPWTPPGWVFGAAWTSIMICFSFYMMNLFKTDHSRNNIIVLFTIQWILNVSWNILFFKYHLVAIALAVIILLFCTTVIFLILGIRQKRIGQILLILPYNIWLIIAISLNAYIFLKN